MRVKKKKRNVYVDEETHRTLSIMRDMENTNCTGITISIGDIINKLIKEQNKNERNI